MSKYPRTYHLPFSPGTTNDDRISESVKSILGIDIIITEKLDGSNSSMINEGVFARSHIDFSKNPWDNEVRQLHEIKVKGNLEDDVFLFGENMEGIHSIEYTNLKSYFYLFGVRDNNIWTPWSVVEEYSYLLDLPLVPVLFKGIVNTEKELKDLVMGFVTEQSELGGSREGIVVRNAGVFHNDNFSDNVMKWVRKGHVQTDEHWTKNWKKSNINY
jgi:hypothetical protein